MRYVVCIIALFSDVAEDFEKFDGSWGMEALGKQFMDQTGQAQVTRWLSVNLIACV